MKTIANLSEMTEDLKKDFRKAVQESKKISGEALRKAGITQSTGLVAFDLQAPAKQLFPVLTPLRNKIPRVDGKGGTATNWKAVTGINTLRLRGFVPEGKRNGKVTTTVVDKNAPYRTLGMEDSVTFEAEEAAQGFEDVRATTGQRLLWATMIEEELAIVGANRSVALGTPTAPTVSVVDGGGTVADATYNVIVVALTLMGYNAASLADGVQTEVTVTPADGGATFAYNAGSSMKSNATNSGAIANGGDSIIRASTPIVPGAVGYAWYVGTAGNETLEAITTINSVELTALTGTGQNASAVTADKSVNTLGYDGFLYHAWASGSGARIVNLATGTPGAGTTLTADGSGGINEVNDMFEYFWENLKLSPTYIYCNSQEISTVTNLVLSGTSKAYIPYVSSGDFASGLRIKSLLNRFAMGGSVEVPIDVHPDLPPGTMLFETETLPYPVNGLENVREMKLRRDYYQMEWPLRTREYESGVYCDGTFVHYFPASLGILTNIAPQP
jgi:hypothetical protein